MKILVTFAVDAEFAPWRNRRTFTKSVLRSPREYKRDAYAEYPVYASSFGSTELRVALTGMGYAVAKAAIATLLDAWRPDVCLSSGLAGATKPEHRVGEILAPETVRPLQGERYKNSDVRLIDLACAQGAKRVGALLSSKHFVQTALAKRSMGSFVDAVDLESFRILCAALGRGIPAAAIRVISDSCDEDMPYDFDRFVDDLGWPSASRAVKQLAMHPSGVTRLSSVVRQANKSAEILADFFERFIPALISEQHVVLSRSAASIS